VNERLERLLAAAFLTALGVPEELRGLPAEPGSADPLMVVLDATVRGDPSNWSEDSSPCADANFRIEPKPGSLVEITLQADVHAPKLRRDAGDGNPRVGAGGAECGNPHARPRRRDPRNKAPKPRTAQIPLRRIRVSAPSPSGHRYDVAGERPRQVSASRPKRSCAPRRDRRAGAREPLASERPLTRAPVSASRRREVRAGSAPLGSDAHRSTTRCDTARSSCCAQRWLALGTRFEAVALDTFRDEPNFEGDLWVEAVELDANLN
jgi:hypothetical protein